MRLTATYISGYLKNLPALASVSSTIKRLIGKALAMDEQSNEQSNEQERLEERLIAVVRDQMHIRLILDLE